MAILSVSFNLACFTFTISIGFDEISDNIASGGNRSGEFLKSNTPPFNFSGDLILISLSSIITDTPNCSRKSMNASSPCGKFPILPLTVISSPFSTANERINAKLEKSIGTVNVVFL